VDAITLSLSLGSLSAESEIPEVTVTVGVIIGAATNTFVKFGIAVFFGGRELGKKVGSVLVTTTLTGLVAVVGLYLI